MYLVEIYCLVWINAHTHIYLHVHTYFYIFEYLFTINPALSATEFLSTPVMKIPRLYSTPPLIIKPKLWPGSIQRSTWNKKRQSLWVGNLLKKLQPDINTFQATTTSTKISGWNSYGPDSTEACWHKFRSSDLLEQNYFLISWLPMLNGNPINFLLTNLIQVRLFKTGISAFPIQKKFDISVWNFVLFSSRYISIFLRKWCKGLQSAIS